MRNRGPSTRMGNVAGYRAAWISAEAYRRQWDKWNADHKGDPPARDLGNETLAEVLRGNILVHNHCYRADEMAQMIDIAHEFGYKIRSFHHGVEAYKIADLLAKEGIGASLWADWGGFKMEAIDAVRGNMALVDHAGARVIVHSDDPSGSQRLNQEAAKAMAAGAADRHPRSGGRGDQVAHDQSGVGAGPRRQDRLDRGGQERRRRAVVGRSVQRLLAAGESVDRRRHALRSHRSFRSSGAPTSSSASCRSTGGSTDEIIQPEHRQFLIALALAVAARRRSAHRRSQSLAARSIQSAARRSRVAPSSS